MKNLRMRKWRNFVVLVLFNLFLMAIGVMVLELIFGAWLFRDPLDLLRIPRNVRIEFTVESPQGPSWKSLYVRDPWGLRGAYPDPSRIDILTIGGSTTDQRLLSEGETWQDVLRQNFALAGHDIVIVNAGVAGQSTFGNIRNFEVWFPYIPGLKAKTILVYVGNNDMFLEMPNAHWDSILNSKKKDPGHLLRDKSALYHLFRTLKGMYLAEKHRLRDQVIDFANGTWVSEPTRSDYREVLSGRVTRYSERLSVLIDRIEAFGARPIIVTQARGDYRFEGGRVVGLVGARGRRLRGFVDEVLGDLDRIPFNGVDHYLILSLFNEASMEVCRRRGAICIDLGNELRFGVGDFYDYVHNTPRGAKKVGDYLFENLRGDPRITF